MKLSNFRVNSQKIEEGEWVSPGEEYDDLLIRSRGFTDGYTDARASKLRRAASRHGGDVGKLPASTTRDITIECMIQHVLLDVKNVVDDDGKQVDFPRFCEMLKNPDYGDLVIAALKAAAIVGTQKVADLEEAAKN